MNILQLAIISADHASKLSKFKKQELNFLKLVSPSLSEEDIEKYLISIYEGLEKEFMEISNKIVGVDNSDLVIKYEFLTKAYNILKTFEVENLIYSKRSMKGFSEEVIKRREEKGYENLKQFREAIQMSTPNLVRFDNTGEIKTEKSLKKIIEFLDGEIFVLENYKKVVWN